MIAIFSQAALPVSRGQVIDLLKKDEDPDHTACDDRTLACFLNGLINEMRGKKEGAQPEPEDRLNNNLIFMKLKIALNLRAEDVLRILKLVGFACYPGRGSGIRRRRALARLVVWDSRIPQQRIRPKDNLSAPGGRNSRQCRGIRPSRSPKRIGALRE